MAKFYNYNYNYNSKDVTNTGLAEDAGMKTCSMLVHVQRLRIRECISHHTDQKACFLLAYCP